jgi:hypothetical protein
VTSQERVRRIRFWLAIVVARLVVTGGLAYELKVFFVVVRPCGRAATNADELRRPGE